MRKFSGRIRLFILIFMSQTIHTEYQSMIFKYSVKNFVRAELCSVQYFGSKFFGSSLLLSWVLLVLLHFHFHLIMGLSPKQRTKQSCV